MLKVVLDTNVFVSSLLVRTGLPARVLDAWREHRYLLVISPSIVAEIRATLNYSRIRNKYALSEDEVEQLFALLEKDALLVPGQARLTPLPLRDSADERFLVCAMDAQADVIVSGDHHLLELGAYQGIPILTVRQFLERLEGERKE